MDNAGDFPFLTHLEVTMEKQLSLPLLKGIAARGENDVDVLVGVIILLQGRRLCSNHRRRFVMFGLT